MVRISCCFRHKLHTHITTLSSLFERNDTRPPQRAQNFVWQYEQLWPQPSANFVLWQIPQVGASPFCSCVCCASSPIFLTCSLYISNCWCNFLSTDCSFSSSFFCRSMTAKIILRSSSVRWLRSGISGGGMGCGGCPDCWGGCC